jgi:hypothetical protein
MEKKMDGANQRFMHGKTTWLADHLIIYNVARGTSGNPFGDTAVTANTELPVHDFDLRKIGNIQTEAGGQAKEYELRGLNDVNPNQTRTIHRSTHAIRAYFLPWGPGKTWCGKLGVNADYFFTPTLNGCTFVWQGVTATNAGPTPSVGHSNFVNALTQQIDQGAMNNDITNKFGALPPNQLVKTDYKRVPVAEEDYRSTVIGIRTGNTWRFYYQNYKVESPGGGKVNNTSLGLCIQI